jgi:hypothetical protein
MLAGNLGHDLAEPVDAFLREVEAVLVVAGRPGREKGERAVVGEEVERLGHHVLLRRVDRQEIRPRRLVLVRILEEDERLLES